MFSKRGECNLNSTNSNIIKFLYIISLAVSFTPRLGDIVLSKNVQLGIGLFWILFAITKKVTRNKFRTVSNGNSDLKWMVRFYFVPTVLIHVWTIILMAVGVLSWINFTTNIGTYIPTLLAISSIYIFGEKAFKINFYALAAAYVISIVSSAVLIGPSIILDGFLKSLGFDGTLGFNYLELHDIVLPLGLVLTYYIFSMERLTKRNFTIIFLTLLIMILGLKRISVLGVFLAVIFHHVIQKFNPRTQYKFCRIAGAVMMAGCFIFIWLLVNGDEFWEIVEPLGINFTGRNYYWKALAELCEFSPKFLGLGRNYTYLLFSGELSYMHVGAAHSDILKMYAENGFILFTYWLFHYLLNLTKKYKEMFSVDAATVYFGITIYLFTLYFTDNVETYFATIMFSILIPASNALRCRGKGQI